MAGWLILLVFMTPCVSYLHFSISRCMHRHEMWEETEKENFETLTLKKATIVWVKKGTEILVNGSYFDVKDIRYEKDSAFVTGIYDYEEQALARQFELEQQSRSNDSPAMSKVKNWWQQTYTCSVDEDFSPDYAFEEDIHLPQPGQKPCGVRHKPLLPPPNSA